MQLRAPMLTPTQPHSPVQRQRSPLEPPNFSTADVHVPVLPAMALSPSAPRTGAERDVLGNFWRRAKASASTTHGIVAAVCVVCIVAAVVLFSSSSSAAAASTKCTCLTPVAGRCLCLRSIAK